MRSILFGCFFLLLFQQAFAEGEGMAKPGKLDSLNNSIQEEYTKNLDGAFDRLLVKLEQLEKGNPKLAFEGFLSLAAFESKLGSVDKSNKFLYELKQKAIQSGNKKKIARVSRQIGLNYRETGKKDLALQEVLSTMKLVQGDIEAEARLNLVTANLLFDLQQNSKAKFYALEAAKGFEKLTKIDKDLKFFIAGNFVILSSVYQKENKLDSAEIFLLKALPLAKAIDRKPMVNTIENHLGKVYEARGDLAKAEKLYTNSIAVKEGSGVDSSFTLKSVFNLAHISVMKREYGKARYYFLKGVDLFDINRLPGISPQFFIEFARFEAGQKNFSKAFALLDRALALKDSLTNREVTRNAARLEAEFDNKKKVQQILISRYQNEKLQEDIASATRERNIFLGGILLVSFLLFFALFNFFEKRKANRQLEVQRDLLNQKNKEVMDSINYAFRIQESLLIPEKELAGAFSDGFVIFMPKDRVSGDFYWFAENEKNIIMAVADCTGHGVPGGFMSMLGHEMLSDILLRDDVTSCALALKILDDKLTQTLNKNSSGRRDGMDIALFVLNKETGKIQYSGANRPLILIRKGELMELKPDKCSVGGSFDQEKVFEDKFIQTEKGDAVYLFSDGYADQFGGERGKKFMFRSLRELLVSVSNLPGSQQKEVMEKTFLDWKGSLEQVDDVLVIGIKI